MSLFVLKTMNKEFDRWNERKKKIHNAGAGRFYHKREIWWCSLGANIGYEQDGGGPLFQRPVLIVKGLSAHTCIVIPLTTSKSRHPMRISLGNIDGEESAVVISQLRVVDTRRFTERLGILEKVLFRDIQKAVQMMF